mgnify:CR=1 FL=1
MYKAYEIAAEKCRYPLHLGVTEAGTESMGVIKSAAGIGGLLLRGIGNTIRISLTDDPVKEVEAGIKLLKAIGIRNDGIKLVSCPTCGRTQIDLIKIASEAEKRLEKINKKREKQGLPPQKLNEKGFTTVAACLDGASELGTVKTSLPVALYIGNEGNGLSDDVIESCKIRLKIPMSDRIESLNAAVSAAVLMWELR